MALFFDSLIDACVLECYFREHMAEKDLLFHDNLAIHLSGYNGSSNNRKNKELLNHLYQTLNAPDSKTRGQLIRLTADSPNLLAIIKGG